MTAGARMHRRAQRLASRVGQAVTFTESTDTYDPTTGLLVAGTAITTSGHAVRDNPTPEQYQALGLTASTAETLLFSPATFGDVPNLGATVEWDGVKYTARLIERAGPDSKPSLVRVVVAR